MNSQKPQTMSLFHSKRIIATEAAARHAKDMKQSNQTIVFTNGCFDIIHPGHIYYLNQAKQHGDILWIGLNTDTSVQALKGPNRPIHPEEARAFVLTQIKSVDFVTLFSEKTPIQLISQIQPHIHVKGGDYNKKDLVETPTVEAYGGTVIIKPFLDGFSTSTILDKAQE